MHTCMSACTHGCMTLYVYIHMCTSYAVYFSAVARGPEHALRSASPPGRVISSCSCKSCSSRDPTADAEYVEFGPQYRPLGSGICFSSSYLRTVLVTSVQSAGSSNKSFIKGCKAHVLLPVRWKVGKLGTPFWLSFCSRLTGSMPVLCPSG